jgi:release factor glutamine methyltransferase
VAGAGFDLIVANPPYVPADDDRLPERGPERAWDAGRDGRAVLDRICREAPAHLRPGGVLLVIHSEICDADATLAAFAAGGLEADVAERHHGALGRLMAQRAEALEARGLLAAGRREEDVLVLRGRAPTRGPRQRRGPEPGGGEGGPTRFKAVPAT